MPARTFARLGALVIALSASACAPATPPGGGPSPGTGGTTAAQGGGGAAASGGAAGAETAPERNGGSAGAASGGASGSGGASASGGSAGSGAAAGGAGAGGSGSDAGPSVADASSSEAAPGESPPMAPAGAAVPSPACAAGAMMPGPAGTQTIMATGKSRTFIIRLPAGYDGKKPFPVMFAFHGAGGGAGAFETGAFAGLSRMVADKAIRIYPQAFGGNTWSRDENDDVLYMDALMMWLSGKVCYDTARVFATGQSSGAYFSHRFACDRGNVVRAVATSSGGQRKERPLDCKTPISAWMSTGAADNPGHVMGTRQARDVWAKLAGCSAEMMPTQPSPCVAYVGCKPGFAVHFCQHGGGHPFPPYGAAGIYDFLFGATKP